MAGEWQRATSATDVRARICDVGDGHPREDSSIACRTAQSCYVQATCDDGFSIDRSTIIVTFAT